MPVRGAMLLALVLAVLAGPAGVRANGPAEPEAGDAAGGDCAEAVARRVQAFYDGIRDLAADFEQTSRVASLGASPGGAEETVRGEVLFAKPGRMRWSYREPEPSLVVTDGDVLWTWDPGLGEAQRMPGARAVLSGAAIQFLMGEGDLLASYEVSARSCGEARVQLTLVPREPASYERLALEVERETGRVRATEVADLFGNVTRVEFSNLRTDTRPPPERFRFEPPDGARVIEVAPAR